MKTGNILSLMTLLSVTIFSVTVNNSFAQTRVALHATQAEIEIWKHRAQNGPYKDDWEAVLDRAYDFMINPESRWLGHTDEGCFDGQIHSGPNLRRDAGLRDAAFVFLVTGDTSYRDASRDALLAQTQVAGTNFSDTSKWCSSKCWISGGYLKVGTWLRRLVYAYSYIRSSLSKADQLRLDAWFTNAANHCKTALSNWIEARFPNRLNDDYRCTGSYCPGTPQGITHYGGYTVYQFHDGWTNIPASGAAFLAAVGVALSDDTFKDPAKRWAKEWVKYSVFPGGVIADQRRWSQGNRPQKGYQYAGNALGSVLTIADHLARAGDTGLYEFSTKDGMHGTASAGNPKTLLQTMKHFAGQTIGTVVEYASNADSNNPDEIINWRGPKETRCRFVVLAASNLYYNDPEVKTAYSTPLPRKRTSGGYDDLGGDWGTYPAIRFMFGQNENMVWPYPSKEETTVLSAHGNLVFARNQKLRW
jgi:hypothetical protein